MTGFEWDCFRSLLQTVQARGRRGGPPRSKRDLREGELRSGVIAFVSPSSLHYTNALFLGARGTGTRRRQEEVGNNRWRETVPKTFRATTLLLAGSLTPRLRPHPGAAVVGRLRIRHGLRAAVLRRLGGGRDRLLPAVVVLVLLLLLRRGGRQLAKVLGLDLLGLDLRQLRAAAAFAAAARRLHPDGHSEPGAASVSGAVSPLEGVASLTWLSQLL